MPLVVLRGLTKRYPRRRDRPRRADASTSSPASSAWSARTGRARARCSRSCSGSSSRPRGWPRSWAWTCADHGTAIRQYVGYMPESDCLPPDVVRDRLRQPHGPDVGPAGFGRPRADGRGPAARRPVRGALPRDRRLFDRHEAAGQARPGPGPRSAAAPARRADQRPRSGRSRRDARARPADRRRVRDRGHRRQPPAGRDRARLRLPRGHRRRAAAPRRAARDVHRADRLPRGRGRGGRGARSPPR